MKLVTKSDSERFQKGAHEYAAYLDTVEGRLRTDLAFANLQEFLPSLQARRQRSALDIGCGTGVAAAWLARTGFQVTQLDSSQSMIGIASRTAEEAGVSGCVTFTHGDATHLTRLFDEASFDVILCHNVLEYVDDPNSVLRGAAHLLRDKSAILSIVVRNRAGEVFKAAIQAGDLAAAEANLTDEWGSEPLYGGNVRLFTSVGLQAMLSASESLELIAERGLRVLADYLPPSISRSSEYPRILELEKKLGSRPEFTAVARYAHCLARRMEGP